MGIKTEDMYKNLPPKVITEGVDWLGILFYTSLHNFNFMY